MLSQLQMNRHPTLKQFSPPKTWVKLQESEFIKNRHLGQPDRRSDCAINSLAFVGAMQRETAETVSIMMREGTCKKGLNSTDIANYFEGNDGSERMPHNFVELSTIEEVYSTFAGLKENMVSLIGINRKNGVGHSATVIRMGGELMVFDAQVETLTPNIRDWLISENASSVEVVLKLDKRVHCRDETSTQVSKHCEEGSNHKWARFNNEEPTRPRPIPRQKNRDATNARFKREVEAAGLDYEMMCRL